MNIHKLFVIRKFCLIFNLVCSVVVTFKIDSLQDRNFFNTLRLLRLLTSRIDLYKGKALVLKNNKFLTRSKLIEIVFILRMFYNNKQFEDKFKTDRTLNAFMGSLLKEKQSVDKILNNLLFYRLLKRYKYLDTGKVKDEYLFIIDTR